MYSLSNYESECLIYITANLEDCSSSWQIFIEDTSNLMTLAFIWQGEPGGAGADGTPGKDGPRVSTRFERNRFYLYDIQ